MGLATIDPNSQKEHNLRSGVPERAPKFLVNQASFTEIQRFKNVKINKEMYGIRTLCILTFQMAVSCHSYYDLAYFSVY